MGNYFILFEQYGPPVGRFERYVPRRRSRNLPPLPKWSRPTDLTPTPALLAVLAKQAKERTRMDEERPRDPADPDYRHALAPSAELLASRLVRGDAIE